MSAGHSTVHPFAATASDPLDVPERRAPPAPLLIPALTLAAGVWLADATGAPHVASWLALGGALFAAVAAILLQRRISARTTVAPRSRLQGLAHAGLLACTGLAALSAGYLRQALALDRPPNHITRALGEDPILARVRGVVVAAPLVREPVVRNPFLPRTPERQTEFIIALTGVGVGGGARPAAGNVIVRVDADAVDCTLGEAVELTGWLYAFRGPRNPGETDWSVIRRRQGIDAGLRVSSADLVRRIAPASLAGAAVGRLRAIAHSMLFEPLATREATECMRLLDVLVLGQRSAADARINDAFQKAGGVHFLSVGGFHVGVLAAFVWWLLRRLAPNATTAPAWCTLAITILYGVLAEPTAPVLRGIVGVALLALATILRRPSSPLNWLAAAATIVLILNPHELFRAGFQLSFVLVGAMIVWLPTPWRWIARRRDAEAPLVDRHPVRDWLLGRLSRWAAGLVMVSVLCWVVALPLTLYHFQHIAPWGCIGAVLLTPWVAATVLLSFATLGASAIPGPLAAWLAAPLTWLTRGMLATVGLFDLLPGAVVETPRPPAWLVVITYATAFAGTWLLRHVAARRRAAERAAPTRRAHPAPAGPRWDRRAVITAGTAVAVLWTGWGLACALRRADGPTVRLLAIGNGGAALLTGPHGEAAMFDCGTIENLDAGVVAARALRAIGAGRLETVVVSHANFDHYSGVPTLTRDVGVRALMTNTYFDQSGVAASDRGRLSAALGRSPPSPRTLAAGDRVPLAGGMLEVLWPPGDLPGRTPANDTSLVARWSVGGTSVLFAGDIEDLALAALVQRAAAGDVDLHADVLVAPHHGEVVNGLTERFMQLVQPAIVAASNERRRPKFDAAVARALGPGVVVHQTGGEGCVTVNLSQVRQSPRSAPGVSSPAPGPPRSP